MEAPRPPSLKATPTQSATPPLPRLDKLPEELVSNIAHRLDYDDVSSLRLSCRAVEEKSFHDFSTEYFSAKAFMLSSESLNVLTGISESHRLRSYLRSIYIVSARFTKAAFECPNGCHCSWQPNVRETEAWKDYVSDQQKLKESGRDKQLLADALQKLPGVKALQVADSPRYGEDLEGARLHGQRKVTRRTSRGPMFLSNNDLDTKENKQWNSHVWRIVCQAIAESGRSTITTFGSFHKHATGGLSVRDDLNLGPFTRAGMTKAFANIESVHFSFRSLGTATKAATVAKQEETVKICMKFASTFSQSKLENVKLSYDLMTSNAVVQAALTKGFHKCSLKKLSINGLRTSARGLVACISCFPALTDLQLSWINLSKGTWVIVLKAIQRLASVDHLHLMMLQEDGRKCYFLHQLEEDDEFSQYEDPAWADDEESDDDEMPELEPAVDGSHDSTPTVAPAPAPKPMAVPARHVDEDDGFRAPGHEGHPERGYYICLKGADKIAGYLPTFINEYNLGEDIADEAMMAGLPPLPPGVAGQAPPAFVNAIMNTLFNGPPPPGGPPPGANAGAGAGAAPQPGQGPVHGPPLPPGFVTNDGNGYTMMMGAMPMPMGMPPPHHGPHPNGDLEDDDDEEDGAAAASALPNPFAAQGFDFNAPIPGPAGPGGWSHSDADAGAEGEWEDDDEVPGLE